MVVGLAGGVTAVAGQSGENAPLTRGEPDLDATAPEPEIVAGTEQEVEIQIQNSGELQLGVDREPVTTARGVTFEITDEGPFDIKSGESSVGSISETETASVPQRISAPSDLEPGSYDITVEMDYSYTYQRSENARQVDDRSGSDKVTITLVVPDEPRFSITTLEDNLAVGYDGVVSGEIENTGSESVDDAVLVVEPMSDSLHIEDTRYALPELETNDVTEFSYPTDVSGQADAGARQLRFTVEYTGDDRDTEESAAMSERVVVDDRADEFDIEGVNTTVKQGEMGDLVVEITNNRPETLSDIGANLYTDSPLDTDNDEAFVPELEPGESALMTFDVIAAPDASTEMHPIELDFQYDTERGDTEVSDVYQYPVTVEAGEENGGIGFGTLLIGGIGLLTAVGVGVAFWRRNG